MPVTLVDAYALRRTRARKESRFGSTPEWKEVLSYLPKMKPAQGLKIELSPETAARSKAPSHAFMRQLRKYLLEQGLQDEYKLFFRGKDARGNRFICLEKLTTQQRASTAGQSS